MKIIISPAKELNLDKAIKEDWAINDKSKEIVNILKELDKEELKKNLKVKDSIVETINKYIEDFDKDTSYHALYMYHGLAYRWMDLHELDSLSLTYLDKNLLILSAMYGPIGAFEKIKAYRLDFNSSIKINGKSLKSFWKDEYNKAIEDDEIVLNLASEEFSCLFNKELYRWIDFEFVEIKDKKIKKHSTISKKARGRMVKYLATNKVDKLEDIKKFDYDGFTFNEESSSENLYYFEKHVK